MARLQHHDFRRALFVCKALSRFSRLSEGVDLKIQILEEIDKLKTRIGQGETAYSKCLKKHSVCTNTLVSLG